MSTKPLAMPQPDPIAVVIDRVPDRALWPFQIIADFGIIGELQQNAGAVLEAPSGVSWKVSAPMPPKNTPVTPWGPSEDQYLQDHYRQSSHQELADQIGRTINAVRNRCSFLKLRRAADHWNDVDLDTLRQWYADHDGKPLQLDDLAGKLGRHKSNVSRKARELGLSNNRRTRVSKVNGYYPSELPKYSTTEERRAAISEGRRQWLAEHEHPRGMLGKKHTPDALAKIGAASTRWLQSATDEQLAERGRKAVMTKIERYGTAGAVFAKEENAYSRARGGRREDLENRYFRSSWEANYARYLNWLVGQGEIKGWEYEVDTFVFHGVTRGAITYTPDFKVTERDGSVVYHEIKGWMDGPSKTRLKRMAKHYPDVRVIVIGEAEYKAIAKWKGLIPEWETGREPRKKEAA